MSKTAKKTVAKKSASSDLRITDDMKITVVKKDNPFGEGTIQAKHANAVLSSKTVAEAKKKGADSWTVRELFKRQSIKVAKAAA